MNRERAEDVSDYIHRNLVAPAESSSIFLRVCTKAEVPAGKKRVTERKITNFVAKIRVLS